jgi:large subunit ribosomal protein L18
MGKLTKTVARERRHKRLRQKIAGTAERPRVSVHISNKNMRVQVIDDDTKKTLVSASTLSADFKKTGAKASTVKGAEAIGTLIAEKAKAAGITNAVFDRGGFSFHGKVKAIAESARKNGLKI